MATKKMSDYFTGTKAADYSAATLSLQPKNVFSELSRKKVKVFEADDGTRRSIAQSNQSIFIVTLEWDILTLSDSGLVFDWFNDPAKGNGNNRTFKWQHPLSFASAFDTSIYTVSFENDTLPRAFIPNFYSRSKYAAVQLRVYGVSP
jgi:hypothetical protein